MLSLGRTLVQKQSWCCTSSLRRLTSLPLKASGSATHFAGRPAQVFSRRWQSTTTTPIFKDSSIIAGVTAGMGLAFFMYLGRPVNELEVDDATAHAYADKSLPEQYYRRAGDRLSAFYKYYADPIDAKLLPDPLPEGQQPPTLVLEYNQLLTYSEWTPENGYRVRVRKGAREFLRYLAQFYEIIIYTSVSAQTADPILAGLQGEVPVIYGALYRESTRYKNGVHIKDLTCLNRDLRQVVMVDTDKANYSLTPDNGLYLPPWAGDNSDTALIDLLPFFVMLATSNLEDLRPVLSYYQDKDVVETYKENQRQIKAAEEEKRKAEEKAAAANKKGLWLFRTVVPVSSDVSGHNTPDSSAEAANQPTISDDTHPKTGNKE